MKKFGWFSLGLGILSFIGAAANNHSVFGPLFWIALGAFLLHKSNQKKSNPDKDIIEPNVDTFINEQELQANQTPDIINENEELNQVFIEEEDQNLESLEEIQAQLTLEQREAAMCMILFFGEYNNNQIHDLPSLLLFKQARTFFGIPDENAYKFIRKYENADNLIDIILTIQSRKAKEFLLLTCYDLIRPTGNFEAYDLLLDIAKDMGYEKPAFVKLIEFYKNPY